MRLPKDENVRVGFWQSTAFFAIFIFGQPDFFRVFFYRRLVSPHVCGERVPRKILQENPRHNPPKCIQQKSPTHFCRGGRAQKWNINTLTLLEPSQELRVVVSGLQPYASGKETKQLKNKSFSPGFAAHSL